MDTLGYRSSTQEGLDRKKALENTALGYELMPIVVTLSLLRSYLALCRTQERGTTCTKTFGQDTHWPSLARLAQTCSAR